MERMEMNPFSGFERKKDYLVCIDSDGCAMDTMDIKHHRCFGPCMVEEWELDNWRDPVLFRWNQVNLYSMTRGINRFKALALVLTGVDREYRKIEGLEALNRWVEELDELSNGALEKAVLREAGRFLKSKFAIIAAGRRSKFLRTSSEISSSEILPVPKVSTKIETGSATPIAYANSISHFSARPAATIFLATYLEA